MRTMTLRCSGCWELYEGPSEFAISWDFNDYLDVCESCAETAPRDPRCEHCDGQILWELSGDCAECPFISLPPIHLIRCMYCDILCNVWEQGACMVCIDKYTAAVQKIEAWYRRRRDRHIVRNTFYVTWHRLHVGVKSGIPRHIMEFLV